MGKKRKAKESDREIDSEVEDDIVKKRNTRGVVGGRKKSFRELAFPEVDSSSEDEDPNVCPVCDDRNDPNPIDNKNRMIGCDGSCEKWFHWSCVGINQQNKPGKHDDWFCRKCSAKRTESSEWRPEVGDEKGLDVLPARDQSSPGQAFKTLAQKKSYDSFAEIPKKSRGRPPGPRSKTVRKSTEIKTPNSKARESWSTVQSSPMSSTSISSNGAAKLPNQHDRNGSAAPGVQRPLLSSDEVDNRLPPGISISKPPPESPSKSPTHSKISPPKSDFSASQLSKYGVSVSRVEEKQEKESFITDFHEDAVESTLDKTPPPPREDCVKIPFRTSGIKLFKSSEKNHIERQLRERGNQMARIKATIEEGDISDDELFGKKKFIYKKSAKPSVEETLNDNEEKLEEDKEFTDGYSSEVAEREIQSAGKDAEVALANGVNSEILQTNQNNEKSIGDGGEKEKDEDLEKEGHVDLWEYVEDESGKKGLSLITKTSNSIVIKPYTVTSGTANSDESNENSSSRLDDTENENLNKISSDDTAGKTDSKNEEMDFPDLDDMLGLSKSTSVQSQKDEAEIQKIKNNLAADFERKVIERVSGGGSVFSPSSNGSLIQQKPVNLPNTKFSHQLPQTILQTSSGALPLLSSTNLTSPSLNSTNGGKIDDYTDGDSEEGLKLGKTVGIKVLKPGELNDKATDDAISSSGASQIQKITAVTPSKIFVQNPSVQPSVQQSYIFSLNRLQSPAQNPIRISAPNTVGGVTETAPVVMSHPLQATGASIPGLQSTPRPPLQIPGATALSSSPRTPFQLAGAVTQGVSSSPRPSLQIPGAVTPGLPQSPRGPLQIAGTVSPGLSSSPLGPLQMTGAISPGSSLSPRAPLQVAGTSPTTRGRARGMRVRGPRPPIRPGSRLVRPGGPRGMRPRGPPPPGMRLVRPGRGMRPGGPRPGAVVRPPSSVPAPAQQAVTATAPVPKPKVLKVECIDVSSDEEDPAPPPPKSATLQKLNSLGISVSRQKAPQIPEGVRLPAGITLSAPGSSSSSNKRSSNSSYNGDSRKRVSVDSSVASALSSVTAQPASTNEPKQKVELELNTKQMEALKALGFL